MKLSLCMLCPVVGSFYFQDLVYPYHSVEPCHFLCDVHIALQELQTIVLLLHRMAFCLSDQVDALHLHNTAARAYLCN